MICIKKWKPIFLILLGVIEFFVIRLSISGILSTYHIYFGDALKGTYEYGIGLLFGGWLPGLIGVILIPVAIKILIAMGFLTYTIIMDYKEQ